MLCVASMLSVASLGAAGAGDAVGKNAALADAVQHGDKQVVLSLLKKRADVNAAQNDGATALHWAAYLNDAETTGLLIRAGANVNARNNYGVSPLALASEQGNARIIEQLMKAITVAAAAVIVSCCVADVSPADCAVMVGEAAFLSP